MSLALINCMEPLARKPRSRENLAEHIRQTARDMARREGWPAVSIRKIVDVIGFSAPIIYEYFDSKDTLLTSIREVGFTQLLADYERIQKRYRDPEKQLYEISLALWDYALGQPEMYDVMYNINGACCQQPLTESPANTAIGDLIRAVLFAFIPKSKESLTKLYLEWWAITHGMIVLARSLSPNYLLYDSEMLYRELVRRFARNLR